MAIITFLWSISLCFIIGLPICKMFIKDDSNSSIVISPIIGFCVLNSILKIFVGFNVAVKYIAWLVAIFSIIQFAIWIIYNLISLKKENRLYSLKKICVIEDKEDRKEIVYFVFGIIFLTLVLSIGLSYTDQNIFGMTRIDGAFYAGHAKMILEYPVAVSLDTLPNSAIVRWVVDSGGAYHRIGIAVFQALLMGTTGISANISSAIMGLLSTILLFCALFYISKIFNFSKINMLIASIFGAIVPGYQMLAFENFYGAVMSVPILILFLCLFWQSTKTKNIKISILSGIVLSVIPTIYMQSNVYAIAGIFIIVVLELLLSKFDKNTLKCWLITISVGILLNAQYISKVLFAEGSGAVSGSPSVLDNLYPYAKNVAGLERNLLGTIYDHKILGIISIMFLLCSIAGLIYYFLRKNTLAVTLLAVSLSGFVFVSSSNFPAIYSFYRCLTMSYPILVIGFIMFIEGFYEFLHENSKDGGGILTTDKGIKFVKIICSVIMIFLIANATNYYLTDSKRVTLSWHDRSISNIDYYSVESFVLYRNNEKSDYFDYLVEKIDANKDKNIIFSSDEMTEWAYNFTLFATPKTYFMQNKYATTLAIDKSFYGDAIKKLNPDDTIIIQIPPRDKKMNDIFPKSEWENICISVNNYKNSFSYNIFSKKHCTANMEMYFKSNKMKKEHKSEIEVYVDSVKYKAQYNKKLNLYVVSNIPVNIKKGYQTFIIESPQNLTGSSITIQD
ncbi:MAG: hypothetical protein RSE39_07735 [Oscillospiraceae bacterium]